MKRIFSVIVAIALAFSVICIPSMADSSVILSEETVYLEDGYYVVITTYEDAGTYASRARGTRSGTRVSTAYNSQDEPLFSLTLNATFEYNGQTADATSATYSHSIIQSGWSLASGSAYCDDDTAIATGLFKKFLLGDVTLNVTLTCSPTGVLY